MQQLAMDIEGMSCGHCVSAVKRALDALDGVSIISLSVGNAEVAFDEAMADAPRILAAVKDAGYDARVSAGRARA